MNCPVFREAYRKLTKIIRLWRFPITDLKIIIDDWKTIVAKIKAGKAQKKKLAMENIISFGI